MCQQHSQQLEDRTCCPEERRACHSIYYTVLGAGGLVTPAPHRGMVSYHLNSPDLPLIRGTGAGQNLLEHQPGPAPRGCSSVVSAFLSELPPRLWRWLEPLGGAMESLLTFPPKDHLPCVHAGLCLSGSPHVFPGAELSGSRKCLEHGRRGLSLSSLAPLSVLLGLRTVSRRC